MRFLILNNDYCDFLHWLYAQHGGLENQSYAEQMRVRMESLFGVADFFSSNLRKLGHEAYDILANDESMQKAWAREHGMRVGKSSPAKRAVGAVTQSVRQLAAKTPLRYAKCLFGLVLRLPRSQQSWFYDILAAQIEHYKPDVLLNHAMDTTSTSFLQEVKGDVHLLIGFGEPPILLNKQDWGVYDLILAPSEGMIDYLRGVGMQAELLRFGFEPRVFSSLAQDSRRTVPVSFVGSVARTHSRRRELLETLCTNIGDNMLVWAPSVKDLPPGSSIRKRYQGPAWGVRSYRTLATSKVTLNCHIDVAGQFADNMRLFEATGVGTLLITDWKVNLHEIFEPGREVVVYRTPEECAELIRYYLEHNDEREAIARAGQERTLREHIYYQRMQELVEIVDRYVQPTMRC